MTMWSSACGCFMRGAGMCAGKPGFLRLWHVCAAVAACVVALVVLTVGRDGGESAADSVSAQLPVVFNIAKPASEILIKSEAGTQITNVVDSGGVSVTEVDVTPYTSWRDGYIYFDDAALKEVMLDIAKEYNYNVEFCNSSMLDVRVHFVAERATGIQGIIDGLNMMNIVNIVCENRTLRVF